MKRFTEIWCVDLFNDSPEGERPTPFYMEAREIISGRYFKYQRGDSEKPSIPFGDTILLTGFNCAKIINCFRSQSWDLPNHLIDLYAEFKCLRNDNNPDSDYSLDEALAVFGIAEKRQTNINMADIDPAWLTEKSTNVENIASLFSKMSDNIDVDRALLRGRYVKAVAGMEWYGIPLDEDILHKLRDKWDEIKACLIVEVDKFYGIYDGLKLNEPKFVQWLNDRKIPWPINDNGTLEINKDVFKTMAKIYPELNLLRELHTSLSQMRLNKLTVGKDGRNRTSLMPFKSRTSRNQPSNSKFIFGPSVWMRGLIKPRKGMGLAYIDFCQQEFGIAAALSGDNNMKRAYSSGDPYLSFAKLAGVVPQNATKETHPDDRDIFKGCILGTQYGMGQVSLAKTINRTPAEARVLLSYHRKTFAKFWAWSDAVLNSAFDNEFIKTELGWLMIIRSEFINQRSIRNFPMQSNGAEILRLACILASEDGIKIIAPVHDAVLIESPLESLDADIKKMQEFMVEAGRIVLDEFELRTDVVKVCWPDRYMDKRGKQMWDIVGKYI